jgi:hypothetical protein
VNGAHLWLAAALGVAPVEEATENAPRAEGATEPALPADDVAPVDDTTADAPPADDAESAGDDDDDEPATEPGETTEPSTARGDDAPEPSSDEILTVAGGSGRQGPPFYSQSDEAELRERHGIEVDASEGARQAKWRCLIADPTCGISFEANATSAYAYRMRQGDVREAGAQGWHSARVQYDLWLNLPVLVETSGNNRFTRISMGPKGGVAFSDSGDLWGNLGIASRYWLGRGRWAPTIEFTTALTFRMGGRSTRPQYDASGQLIEPKFRMTRGPAGISADIGFGFGGFGAIIVGGQYDSPFAREDVPEVYRTPAAGMFFVGFRGNILWGGPAGAAVLTHVLAQRYAGPGV